MFSNKIHWLFIMLRKYLSLILSWKQIILYAISCISSNILYLIADSRISQNVHVKVYKLSVGQLFMIFLFPDPISFFIFHCSACFEIGYGGENI